MSSVMTGSIVMHSIMISLPLDLDPQFTPIELDGSNFRDYLGAFRKAF